jgi:peptidoglycan/xylan/chitin deacetylase (PgdA/CDA1 family)
MAHLAAAAVASLTSVLVAGLLAVVVLGSPQPVVDALQARTAGVLFSVETDERVVALTIDDGPSSATPRILDVLEAHDAKATLFLIGEHLDAHPGAARQAVEEGHELANHMLVDEPSIRLSGEDFRHQLVSTEQRLAPLGGARLLRPGSGWVNDRMIDQAAERGYRTVLGSVYPFDVAIPAPRFLAWYVTRNVRPGSIIVLHDGPGRGDRTAEVLGRVLPELRQRGFRVVTVTELLEVASSQ